MRDIYLIDFENVSSEGLSGITYLSEEDQVIIFYSNNSNRISMKMHILVGKSVCRIDYFEVLVGGKNALDHQLSTWLGYLIGTGAAERNYYIVSRDMGYKHVANFWTGGEEPKNVRCIDAIRVAGRLERQKQRQESETQEMREESPEATVVEATELPASEPEAVEEPTPVEGSEVPEQTTPAEEDAPEALAPAEEEKQEERVRSFRHRNHGKSSSGRSRQTKTEKTEAKPGLEQLGAMIAPYPALQENHLRQLIADNKKQILCNTLRKQLGQEKGLALYNEIKKIAWR